MARFSKIIPCFPALNAARVVAANSRLVSPSGTQLDSLSPGLLRSPFSRWGVPPSGGGGPSAPSGSRRSRYRSEPLSSGDPFADDGCSLASSISSPTPLMPFLNSTMDRPRPFATLGRRDPKRRSITRATTINSHPPGKPMARYVLYNMKPRIRNRATKWRPYSSAPHLPCNAFNRRGLRRRQAQGFWVTLWTSAFKREQGLLLSRSSTRG